MSPLGNWDCKGPRHEPPIFHYVNSLGGTWSYLAKQRHPALVGGVRLTQALDAQHSPAQTRS